MNPHTTTGKRHRLLRRLGAVVAATLATGALTALTHGHDAAAAPLSGSTPWAVLLCKASGTTAEPKPPAYFQKLFVGTDSTNPTMLDYWSQVSNGTINLTYSQVSPAWVQTTRSITDLQAESRVQKLKDCVDAAGSQITNADSTFGIIAVWNVDFTMATDTKNFGDSGAAGIGPITQTLNGSTHNYAGLVIEPWALYPSVLEHEMGHGYGLVHGFGMDNCYFVSQADEYCDPYTTMGASGGGYQFAEPAYTAPDGPTSSNLAGPGLDAFDLDTLGFIPATRKATVPIGQGQATAVTLTSLSAPNAAGNLMASIPIGDYPGHAFTVEYRRKLNWDRGLNDEGIVIHEVKSTIVPNEPELHTYLVERSSNWADGIWTQGQTMYNWRGFSITVWSVNPVANTAMVIIAGPPNPVPAPSTTVGPVDNGQGGGGCGATGCGQHPPGWHPAPIRFQ